MGYRPLLTTGAPEGIREFVRRHLDMQLHDVHTMLRLPLDDDGMEGGCNFASVATLCGVIAGASTVFFRQSGGDGSRFRDLLRVHYPWADQPKGGVDREIAVEALWTDYRNPLAHALAVSTETRGRGEKKVIEVDSRARPLGVVKRALTESAVMALEQPDGLPPSWLTPVITMNAGGGLDLYPHSFYWGTRRLLEVLFKDEALMQRSLGWFSRAFWGLRRLEE